MSKINIEEAFRDKRKANPALSRGQLATRILRAYKRELKSHGIDLTVEAYNEGVAALETALEKVLLSRAAGLFCLTDEKAWQIRKMSVGSGHTFDETVDILLTAILEIVQTETVE